ncbi:MAG: AAA family ATPase, partial [Candidatus Omnitrophica bacterium CG12_big_fil_rev_8_21_14_0_65_50_5]
YPIRLAWAITIHKSQGKTFEKVIIDTGDGAFAHGQMYVALSRCTRLDGIVLRRKLRRSDLILDERILNFLSVRPADTSERSIEV